MAQYEDKTINDFFFYSLYWLELIRRFFSGLDLFVQAIYL